MKNFLIHFIFFFTILSFSLLAFYILGKDIWYPYYKKCFVEQQVQAIPCKERPLPPTPPIEKSIPEPCPECPSCKEAPKLTSEQKLKRYLADSNFVLYPKKLTLIALKNEQLLEVWGELNGQKIHIRTYPFTAFSGRLGPKFREGDRQIPEGIYGISYLNPNSKFHLSMRVNYPNAFDRKMAQKEGRTHLGGDIMIHGSDRTIGCIPIGDDKIEELYFLAEQVGIENIKVILSPIDFRLTDVKIKTKKHPWIKDLYRNIKKEMKPYRD
jgi:murein L,D-transpeptidase YafK